jgi:hypothetical protein
MIATTTKNGQMVRLSAEFHIDTGTLEYTVYCKGKTFCFEDFAPAARIYKDLSRLIEDGLDLKARLGHLVNGARLLGFTVKEV